MSGVRLRVHRIDNAWRVSVWSPGAEAWVLMPIRHRTWADAHTFVRDVLEDRP